MNPGITDATSRSYAGSASAASNGVLSPLACHLAPRTGRTAYA